MSRDRFQTYVFDTQFSTRPESDPVRKAKGVLGPEYKESVPVAWSDGNALKRLHQLEEFARFVRDEWDDRTLSPDELVHKAEELLTEIER